MPRPVHFEIHAENPGRTMVDVGDVDAFLKRIPDLGGSIALAKLPDPTTGWLGYAKDTEGNLFGIIPFDPSAKM